MTTTTDLINAANSLNAAATALGTVVSTQANLARDQAQAAAAVATSVLTVSQIASTSYTVLPTDWTKQLEFTAGTAVTVTINASSLVGVTAGSVMAVTQAGIGVVSVVGSGVTVRNVGLPLVQYATSSFQVKANGEVWAL